MSSVSMNALYGEIEPDAGRLKRRIAILTFHGYSAEWSESEFNIFPEKMGNKLEGGWTKSATDLVSADFFNSRESDVDRFVRITRDKCGGIDVEGAIWDLGKNLRKREDFRCRGMNGISRTASLGR